MIRWWSINVALRKALILSNRGWEFEDYPRWIRWRIRIWNFTEKLRSPISTFRAWLVKRRIKKLEQKLFPDIVEE